MKRNTMIFLLGLAFTAIFSTCKKNKDKGNNAELLIQGGTWNLIKWKKGNDNWKDSTGTYYNFVKNDTIVVTNKYGATPNCKGRYTARNSVGYKTFDILYWDCSYASHTFNVESISNNEMIIFYQDEISGRMYTFKEHYVR